MPPKALNITQLAPLPKACVDGGGARVDDMLYVGLGSAGKEWYRLDLPGHEGQWRRCADFPGPAPSCPVVIGSGQAIYVFGGFGKTGADATTAQFDTVHRYLPGEDRWEQLPTVLPVGLTGASAIAPNTSTLYFFGGYHHQQFDLFHRELETASPDEAKQINTNYMRRPIAQFGWNRDVWEFDIAAMRWRNLGTTPHQGNCKATAIADGKTFFLVGGEVKPGLRASTIKHASLDRQGVKWHTPQAVPVSDGLAGAFGGRVGEKIVIAGGTHFPGAWQKYAQGEYFAHEGLRKKWLGNIYVLVENQWWYLGSLPHPRANGVSIQSEDGLILVAGDTSEGRPCLDTLWLRPTNNGGPISPV